MSVGRAEKCLKAMTEFYVRVFGEKWRTLLKDMEAPKSYCALVNNMVEEGMDAVKRLEAISAVPIHLKYLHQNSANFSFIEQENTNSLMCFKSKFGEFQHPSNYLDCNGKMAYFLMDLSSLIPVLALDIKPSDFVLDMCASPGGKTLAIAMQLSHNGQLVSNEFNYKRRKRLYKVLDDYLPKAKLNHIKVTSLNGTSFSSAEPSTFNKVLVDAPCSSDRHLIHENFRYSGWSLRKSREFAELQKKLLISAINSVQVGGTIVYSTCSLSPIENDGVVDSAMAELHSTKVETVNFVSGLKIDEFCTSDTTKHGLLVIPSKAKNWGPMYTCKLLRVS